MIVEHWEPNPVWLGYVLEHWKGIGRVEQVKDYDPIITAFQTKAHESFTRLGFPVVQVKTYLSVQKPEDGEGYAEQYPHIHYPTDGITLVHYLQSSDKPVYLDFLEDGKVIERLDPQPSMAVIFNNHEMHGAHKNTGTIDRVQLIATALRR